MSAIAASSRRSRLATPCAVLGGRVSRVASPMYVTIGTLVEEVERRQARIQLVYAGPHGDRWASSRDGAFRRLAISSHLRAPGSGCSLPLRAALGRGRPLLGRRP